MALQKLKKNFMISYIYLWATFDAVQLLSKKIVYIISDYC